MTDSAAGPTPTTLADQSQALDPLLWTVEMALLVVLPCPNCGRTERCRCRVSLADRTAQRAEFITTKIRERFPDGAK